MKFKYIPWLFLVITLLITSTSGYEYFLLNRNSINVAKTQLQFLQIGELSNEIVKFSDPDLECRSQWLEFIYEKNHRKNYFNSTVMSELLACSPVHMRMLQRVFPEDQTLAKRAITLYPSSTIPLYWYLQATDPGISNVSKGLIQQILSINPKDGLAWRYLGIILIQEGDIPAAIEAHINCCFNGDPGSNGCYNAGRLFEQIGEYEEAIYYYRLSRHEPYRANADRIEEMLAGRD